VYRHHHVESVHFNTSMKCPLHPALAVVQTPSREYFILRENGMQIGCEEEGIADSGDLDGDYWLRFIRGG